MVNEAFASKVIVVVPCEANGMWRIYVALYWVCDNSCIVPFVLIQNAQIAGGDL
jgi:hypothetical protein